MAHAEDQFLRAELPAASRSSSSSGSRDGVAFEREALGSEIARLKDLLEEFRADQVIENALLIDGGRSGFHMIGEPSASLRISDVGELDADATAINAPGFLRDFAFGRQFGVRLGPEKAERIEFRLDVSPAAEQLKNTFTLAGWF